MNLKDWNLKTGLHKYLQNPCLRTIDRHFTTIRGSQEPVITNLVLHLPSKFDTKKSAKFCFTIQIFFLLTVMPAIWDGAVKHKLDGGQPKIISSEISVQKFLKWFSSHNMHYWYKLAEKKITEKPGRYVEPLDAV